MQEFRLPIRYNWELAHKPITEVCSEQPYRTGIYDDYPWYVTPIMVSTCNTVIDTPAFPTAVPTNLQGYKVIGSTFMYNESLPFVQYIGTVEISNTYYVGLFPWKTEGTVLAYDDNFGEYMSSAFANGALVTDSSSTLAVNTNYATIMVVPYAPGAYDLFLVINVDSMVIPAVDAEEIAFEYSFFAQKDADVKFTIY